jgi:hypothetical protein
MVLGLFDSAEPDDGSRAAVRLDGLAGAPLLPDVAEVAPVAPGAADVSVAVFVLVPAAPVDLLLETGT